MYMNSVNFAQWLEKDFLGYLQKWEDMVKSRPGFSPSEKEKMLLTRETRVGIKITGKFSIFCFI